MPSSREHVLRHPVDAELRVAQRKMEILRLAMGYAVRHPCLNP